jgi:hypothetical protein
MYGVSAAWACCLRGHGRGGKRRVVATFAAEPGESLVVQWMALDR